MRRGFPLGRIFGTDIEATLGLFLVLGYVLFWMVPDNVGLGAIIGLTFVVSIVVHEFGHVFAVKALLKQPCRIILWAFGGLCVYPRPGGLPTPPKKQLAISLAGPAMGLTLAGAAWLARRYLGLGPGVASSLIGWLFIFNLVVNLANLLPIWPLDGGQALRAILTAAKGPIAAKLVTRYVSIACGGAAALVAFRFGYQFAGIMAILLVVQNLTDEAPTGA